MTKVFAIGSEAIVVALLWKQTARRIWKHHLREVLLALRSYSLRRHVTLKRTLTLARGP